VSGPTLSEMLPALTGDVCWCFWCFDPEAESRVFSMLEELFPSSLDQDALKKAKVGRLAIERGQLPGLTRQIIVIFTPRKSLSEDVLLPARQKHLPEIVGEPSEGPRVLAATDDERAMVSCFLEGAKTSRIIKWTMVE
jgi:hypothetical protein